jgi:hypothetical protein
MLRLYQAGGGSPDIDLVRPVAPELASRAIQGAAGLLTRRGNPAAADLLLNTPFQLWHGTNGFGDDFYVLHAKVPTAKYAQLMDIKANDGEPAAVPSPTPARTTDVLDAAISEVERVLAEGRPAVAVDRVHTSFHAYLREHAESANLSPASDAGITDLFRLLRDSHPGLQETGPRAGEVTKVLRAMATIVDSLNPLRNNASLAHANELLPDAEAMLVINAVRTLMHYLEKRLS